MFIFTETHLKRHYVVVSLRIVTLPTDRVQAGLTSVQLLHLTIMDNCIFKMEAALGVVVPLLLSTEYCMLWPVLMVVTPIMAVAQH